MTSSFIVSEEDFKIFHNIDRTLYRRLVLNLGCDKEESKQVMAFWIWLETSRLARDLVHKMLSLPDGLINTLAEEAILCLNFMKNDHLHFPLANTSNSHIPLTRNATKSWLTIEFFHDNRLSVLRGVTTILNDVCTRAFDDINKQALEKKGTNSRSNFNTSANNIIREPFSYFSSPILAVKCYDPALGIYSNYNRGGRSIVVDNYNTSTTNLGVDVFVIGADEMEETLKKEVIGGLGRLKNNDDDQEKKDLHVEEANEEEADERTIFLTFSRGYPISEIEVRDFFTRKFGHCIEAIHMQEIQRDEQPLYARLVVRSASTMQAVFDGKGKAKFSINGKHLWARKYVWANKNPSPCLPPQASSSSGSRSSPTSALEA